MNKIRESLLDLRYVQARLEMGIIPGLDNINEIEEKITKRAYELGNYDLLVNQRKIDTNTINISNFEYGEDYSVLTEHADILIDGEYHHFNSEDEYMSYCSKTMLNEEIEDWYNFAEQDEIMWNVFYRYDNRDIDIEVANMIGLPVIELNNGDIYGETYISISGCGMDLSFQLMEYQAHALGYIDSQFANTSSLNWAKQNISEDRFNKMMEKLGVVIDNIDNIVYTK